MTDAADLFSTRAAHVPGSTIAWGVLSDGRTATGCTDGVHARSAFPIASLTKVFTGTLLALMVRRGELRLDTRIGDLVDRRLAAAVAGITVVDLATHTSGLPRLPPGMLNALPDSNDPYAAHDRDALLADLAQCAEGSILDGRGTYEYSNLGAAVLGMLLVTAAGRDYAQLLAEEIFEPLGMSESFVNLSGHDPARPIVDGMNADGTPVPTWRFDAFAPAGGIISSICDLLALARELLGGTSPLADALRDATVPRLRQPQRPTIGLFWMCEDGIRWHNGGTYGHHAMLALHLERREAAVALWNAASSLDDICMHLVQPEFPIATIPNEVALPATHFERFAGTYDKQYGGTLTIEVDGSRGLMIDGANGGRCRLYARTGELFFSKQFPESAYTFTFDANGEVVGMEQTVIAGFTVVRAQRRSASSSSGKGAT